MPDDSKNQNIMEQPCQTRKMKIAEVRMYPYKERAILLKTKLTSEEEMFGEWLFNLQGSVQ